MSATPTHPMQDRVALVTGAAGGIGRATALAFASQGAALLVADINGPGAEETAHLITAAGGQAIARRVDVTDSNQVEQMVQQAITHFGRLDYAHNNAGIAYQIEEMGPLAEQSEAVWDKIINVNLKGVWLCLKHELPYFVGQQRGAIVNTSSIFGLVAAPGYSAYIASKHGVAGLTKAAAVDYARYNIRVNAVCPGFIATQMVAPIADNPRLLDASLRSQAIRRPGEPEEVAAAVVWLCSDQATFVTGHMMSVDGGQAAR
ncbi:MAG: SDR family oxidoreductase [Caldilineaceae bacterium]|nr:SDR family oxidoreductase [Caldilineaceae bacterium]